MDKNRLLINNPLRVLGVYVGEPASREASNYSRIMAYAKVQQDVTIELRGDDKLPPPDRGEASADNARQILSLPHDRLKYSLFWYADSEEPWALCLNSAVDALAGDDGVEAARQYERLLSDPELRVPFVVAASHGLYTGGETEALVAMIDMLSAELPDLQSYIMCSDADRDGVLFRTVVPVVIQSAIDEIIKGLSVCMGAPVDVAVSQLRESTASASGILAVGRDILGVNNLTYQKMATKAVGTLILNASVVLGRLYDWCWTTRADDTVLYRRGKHTRKRVYELADNLAVDTECLVGSFGLDSYSKDEIMDRLDNLHLKFEKIENAYNKTKPKAISTFFIWLFWVIIALEFITHNIIN